MVEVTSILPINVRDAVVKKRRQILLGPISLALPEHGFTMVIGPNGAGKTTLLRLIYGLEFPKHGDISWNLPKSEVQKHQAFIFQTPIMMRRSVVDNICYPLLTRGINKSAAQEQAKQWAQKVGLGEMCARDAMVLSGGEKQKLAIARALIIKPQILFLDEPTTNLDGKSTREIEELLLQTYHNGTRIVMTTHNLAQAKRLASDIIFLNKGQLMEQGTADAFFNQPSSSTIQQFLHGDILE